MFTRMFSPCCFPPTASTYVFQLRTLISDFAIIISILVFCGLDCLLALDTPKLHVPTELKVHPFLNTSPILSDLVLRTLLVTHFFPQQCSFYRSKQVLECVDLSILHFNWVNNLFSLFTVLLSSCIYHFLILERMFPIITFTVHICLCPPFVLCYCLWADL